MLRQFIALVLSVLGIMIIVGCLFIELPTLNRALSAQLDLPVVQVTNFTQQLLLLQEQARTPAASLGTLDAFVQRKEQLWEVYLLLLQARLHELGRVGFLLIPWIGLGIYDLWLSRKIQQYNLVFLSSLRKGVYFYLTLSCLVLAVLCITARFTVDLRIAYLAIVGFMAGVYILRLHMKPTVRQAAIS